MIGPRSNAGFLAALCRAPAFRAGDFDTGFIERNLAALGAAPQGLDRAAAALGAQELLARESARIAAIEEREPDEPASPWDAADGFQLAGARRLALPILADGENVVAQVVQGAGRRSRSTASRPRPTRWRSRPADAVYVLRHGRQTKVALARSHPRRGWGSRRRRACARADAWQGAEQFWWRRATRVTRGQRLAIIEAMKMEHTLVAPIDGTVAEIAVAVDAQVAEGAKVMVIAWAKTSPRIGPKFGAKSWGASRAVVFEKKYPPKK